MNLEELIKQLVGAGKIDEIVNALQGQAHSIYQAIFDRGFGAKTAEVKPEIERLTSEKATAIRERDEAKRLVQESKTEPADWQRQRTEFETQVRTLTEERDAARREKTEGLITERKSGILSKLESKLLARGVRPAYASVLVEKKDVADRVKPLDDPKKFEVLQAGKAIPLSVADGQDALDLLADELVKDVHPDLIVKVGDRGAGLSSSDQGSGGSYLSDLKARVTKEREEKAKASTNIPLQERLRVVR